MADRELGLRFYKWLLTQRQISFWKRMPVCSRGRSLARVSQDSDVSSSRTLPMRLLGSGAQSLVLLRLLVILKSRMDS